MRSINSLMDMTGRVVLVTGGAGHIGASAASTFLELGADVLLLDRDNVALAEVSEDLRTTFGRAPASLVCDLEDEASWRAAVSSLGLDHLDVLVQCAALVGTTPLEGWTVALEEQSLATWRRALEVNLTAPFGLVQAFLPQLRAARNGGVLVNVSSIYGLVGPDLDLYEGSGMGNPAGYGVTKAGMIQMTRWLSTVLAPAVRANAIAPGGVARSQPAEFVDRYRARTPMDRLGTEEDLKGAFAYLGSDLSAYVTGHTLVVDGGWTAW